MDENSNQSARAIRSAWGGRCASCCAAALIAGGSAAFAQTGEISLTDNSAEDIVISASYRPIALATSSASVTVIDAEDLELQGIRSLSDALRSTPGAAVSRSGGFGGLTQIRLRGAEGNHVLVRIDGIEIAPADSGEVDLSSLLAFGVERIEVLRGPQSGLFGSNAIAGVIDITTAGGSEGLASHAFIESGSFDTLSSGASVTFGDETYYGAGSIAYRRVNGFNTAQTGGEEDFDQNLSATARGGATVSEALRVDGSFRYTDKNTQTDDFDFSGGPNQGLIVDAIGRSDTRDINAGGRAELTLLDGDWVSETSIAYVDTQLEGSGSFGLFGSETSRLAFAGNSSLDFETGGSVTLSHRVTAFVDHEREAFRNTQPSDPSQVPQLKRNLTGIGAEYRAEAFDSLYVSGAVRRDFNDAFADVTTFRAGAVWVSESLGARLHGQYGTGVTIPTFTEQFGFTPGFFVGNPDLTPEKARGWDVGVEQTWELWDGGDLRLDVTYFQSVLTDEIVSLFPSVANDAGESRRKGVEVVADAQLLDGFEVAAAYTYTDAEDPDGSREVRRPEHMARFDVSYRFAQDRASLALSVLHNGEQLDNDFRNFFTNGFASEKTALNGYTLVGVNARYKFTKNAELFARVENALDETYEEVIGYNTPGLSVYGGIRINFGPS